MGGSAGQRFPSPRPFSGHTGTKCRALEACCKRFMATRDRRRLQTRASNGVAWELLFAGSLLAPWTSRQAEAPLPPNLRFGVVQYLEQALDGAKCPNGSARLKEDSLVLVTYGANFLSLFGHVEEATKRVTDHEHARRESQMYMKERTASIRDKWRTLRFPTRSLGSLNLKSEDYLIAETQGKPRFSNQGSATLGGNQQPLAMVPVEINEHELRDQIDAYSKELQMRVDARYHRAEQERLHFEREQRNLEERKKKFYIQRKRRRENACRKWNYFTERILLRYREMEELPEGMRDRQVSARLQEIRRLSMERKGLIPKRAVIPRAFIRHVVGRIISRGLSRVLCNNDITFTRQRTPYAGVIQQSISPRSQTPATSASGVPISGNSALRIGLLLCDLHFGEKYSGLYQKYFDRAAAAKGRVIQWQLFDCIKSEFPTRSYQRQADGFLVAGGPTSGHSKSANCSTESLSEAKSVGKHRRKEPGWRRSLVRLLRYLHSTKQPLAALGLGHVILAEAFGGTCAVTGWQDGWNVIPAALCGLGSYHHHGYPEPMKLGIKYLHGEYVKKMPRARKDLESWRSSDDRHVAGFRDRNTISFDGFPECGAFIFEAMSDFYDQQALEDGEGDSPDSANDWAKGESVPTSLEQKKRTMKIKDGSNTVADLILDHFVALSTSPKTSSINSKTVEVIASISSDHILDSIKSCWSHHDIGGVVIPLISTSDGHALVLSRKILESSTLMGAPRLSSSRRSSLTSETKPFHLPTLHELHFQLSILGQESPIESQRRLHRGSFKEIRAASQRRLSGGSRRSITSLQIGDSESHCGEHLHSADLSAIGLVRFAQAIASCTNDSSVRKGSGRFRDDIVDPFVPVPTVIKHPRVVLEFLDYKIGGESPQLTFIRKTEVELRTLWIQFIASFRLHSFGDTKIAIISCQASLLAYFRQRQPLWKLIKDCRVGVSGKPTPARYLVSKLGQYTTFADAILLHHEVVLSFSAREIEVVLQQARVLGLRVYVSWSSAQSTSLESPRRMSISSAKGSSISHRRRSSARMIPPLASCSEEDTTKAKLIECVLLLLLGVHGIISAEVDIVMDAKRAIAEKSELVRDAQQLLSKWQGSEATTGFGPKKRPSYSRPTANGTSGSLEISLDELDEDYMGDISQHEDDYSVVEKDVAAEILKLRSSENATDAAKAVMRPIEIPINDGQRNKESPGSTFRSDGSWRGPLSLLVNNSDRKMASDTKTAPNQVHSLMMSGLGTKRRLTQPAIVDLRPHPPPPDCSRRNSAKIADDHLNDIRPAEFVLGSGVRMGRRLSIARGKSSGTFHATGQPAVGPL